MLGGDGGGRVGGANCRLMRRVTRLVRMAERAQAAGHGARVILASVLLCACWRVTHFFSLLRTFLELASKIIFSLLRMTYVRLRELSERE